MTVYNTKYQNIVRLLVENDADVNAQNFFGETALIRVAKSGKNYFWQFDIRNCVYEIIFTQQEINSKMFMLQETSIY